VSACVRVCARACVRDACERDACECSKAWYLREDLTDRHGSFLRANAQWCAHARAHCRPKREAAVPACRLGLGWHAKLLTLEDPLNRRVPPRPEAPASGPGRPCHSLATGIGSDPLAGTVLPSGMRPPKVPQA
jgi:hypothetical protein